MMVGGWPLSRRIVALGGIATGALALGALLLPGRTALVVHVWLLAVVGAGVAAALSAITAAAPRRASSFTASLTTAPRPLVPPASLGKLERELSMGTETAFDSHARIRPLFAELADGILRTRYGSDLTRVPAARQLLGEELWEIVRPGVDLPERRSEPGFSLDTLDRATSRLEELAWN